MYEGEGRLGQTLWETSVKIELKFNLDGKSGVFWVLDMEPVPVPAPTPVPPPPPLPEPAPTFIPVIGRAIQQRPLTITGLPGGYPQGVELDMARFNPYVFHCSARVVQAHPLRFDSAVYTAKGAVLSFNQFNVNTNRRDVWISDAPGSALRVDPTNFGSQALANAENSNLYVTFDKPTFGAAFLQRDKTYWLNVMATNIDEPMNYFMIFNPSDQV